MMKPVGATHKLDLTLYVKTDEQIEHVLHAIYAKLLEVPEIVKISENWHDQTSEKGGESGPALEE